LLLAVAASVAELLPIIGPWLGTAPAVLLALTQGIPLALLVLAFGVAVQLLEANVLLPRVLGRAVGVPPLVVFLSVLAGAELFGILGALLAVPVAAALQVLHQQLHASPAEIDLRNASADQLRDAA
jgi:predicted PurR-regulated permease PerM